MNYLQKKSKRASFIYRPLFKIWGLYDFFNVFDKKNKQKLRLQLFDKKYNKIYIYNMCIYYV